MRGTHADNPPPKRGIRFIPALAGNTCAAVPSGNSPPVHPRACGEHTRRLPGGSSGFGSSPRLRGTLPGARRRSGRPRFIPALAGNTSGLEVWSYQDYGSSPRLRGTPADARQLHFPERFIPALAGNTLAGCTGMRPKPVHPRACGEHAFLIFAGGTMSGSSPRLRG